MFNPFVKFFPDLIDSFRRHGDRYMVSQTFKSACDMFSEEKDVLMFSQYGDMGYAQIHLNAVKADRFAAIIDLEKEHHRTKIMQMLAPESRYLVFSCLIKNQRSVEEAATKTYAHKLRRYIEKNTTWRKSGSGSLRPKLQLIFGELFIVVRYGSQHLRIKFEEIETL